MARLYCLTLIALPHLCVPAMAQEKSVKEFVDALKHADARVRLSGLAGLSGTPEAAPHVETIARLLKDVAPPVRRAAAQVLGSLGKDAQKAAPALAAALKDSDPAVKQFAAKALVDIGPAGVSALAVAFKDADPTGRLLALNIIEALAADAPDAVKILALAVKDPSGKVRGAAIALLGKMAATGDPKEIGAALAGALTDKSGEVRGAAITALFELDKPGAIPHLVKALKDETPAVRQTAAQALGSIGDELDMAGILALIGRTEDSDAKVRQYAAAGLAKAGVQARSLGGKALLPALFKLMKDKESNVRQTAVYALGHIGIDSEEDIKLLAAGLKDEVPVIRAFTVQALAQYSHDEALATWRHFVLTHVAEGLKDKDKRVVATAGNILLGEKGFGVPGLIRVVDHGMGPARILAAQILSELGEEAVDALPALRKMSGEGTAENRQAALTALKKIMP